MTQQQDAAGIAAAADILVTGAGVRERDDLCVVSVQGDDAVTWLNGQITADVRHLQPGGSVHGLSINVRGKVMAEVWVLAQPAGMLLLLPTATATEVLESLERYIIMEDVTLTLDEHASVISVQGARAASLCAALVGPGVESFPCDELGLGGVFLVTSGDRTALVIERLLQADSCVVQLSEAAFELARLRTHTPRFGRDYDGRSYPQEAGLKALLSFNKGCYLGQEVVCTLENRGKMHRHLCALHTSGDRTFTAPVPLTTKDGETCGELTSCVHDPVAGNTLALGYVKSAMALPEQHVHALEATWTIGAVVGENA